MTGKTSQDISAMLHSKAVFSYLFLFVFLLLAGCGGGGGGNDQTPDLSEQLNLAINSNPAVDSTSSYTLRKSTMHVSRFYDIYQPIMPGLDCCSFLHAISYADFNGDGHTDIFISRGNSSSRTAVQVLLNDGADNFSDRTAITVRGSEPGAIHPRKALTGDYNGDGWPDAFIIGHGRDASPWPGEYPLLFLSNGDGTLSYASGYESLIGFHHGGASADIDADGDVDILVADTKVPFFLINNSSGVFTKDTQRLTSELNGKGFFTAELIDIDKDGFVDLIAGGHEHEGMPSVIYWGSGSGTYKASQKTVLPAVNGWKVVLDFAAEDINGDGLKDVIINRTGNNPFYSGRYIQILMQTSGRNFSDETASRISMDTSLGWFDFLRVQDVDGDGKLDILKDDNTSWEERAWRNDGNGYFSPYSGPINPAL